MKTVKSVVVKVALILLALVALLLSLPKAGGSQELTPPPTCHFLPTRPVSPVPTPSGDRVSSVSLSSFQAESNLEGVLLVFAFLFGVLGLSWLVSAALKGGRR